MSAASIVVGAVLTFASVDGTTVALTVSTSETATATLQWGDIVRTSTIPARLHRFEPLPMPKEGAVAYEVRSGRGAPFVEQVKAIPKDNLRIAVYGDSRGGPGPHRALLAAIRAEDPHVIVHTGDVVQRAGIEQQWANHLALSLPVSARIPVVFALGNHELWQPKDTPAEARVDALAEAMHQVPPPPDLLARAAKADIATFHVRVGDVLIAALNSNTTMAADSAQMRFLDSVVAANPDAKVRFAAMHHGPASSGRHGPHRHSKDVIAAFERLGITASLAGHDHLYERIERGPVTYVVSGGGGAPLYQRRHVEPGSAAFASTYNWMLITLRGERLCFEAYSLEGVLLDSSERAVQRQGVQPSVVWWRLGAAGLIFAAMLTTIVVGLSWAWPLARGGHDE